MLLTVNQIADIRDGINLCARENARETDGVTFDAATHTYSNSIQDAYRASVYSIGESCQSPREFRDYAPRILTAAEVASIIAPLLAYGY